MTYTDEDARRVEACLLEGGLVKGVDYDKVACDDDRENLIVWMAKPGPSTDRQDRIMWRAFSLCGLTDITVEEWIANAHSHDRIDL